MKHLILVVMLVFVGCTLPDDPSVKATNKDTLSGEGELVGTLKDGREVRRFKIDMGSNHDHWLYTVGTTVTINSTVSQGKTTTNMTQVMEIKK